MTAQNDLTYDMNDTFEDLYEKLNNKYLNPVVTSSLILAKAIRGVFNEQTRPHHIGEVVQLFGGDDDQPAA